MVMGGTEYRVHVYLVGLVLTMTQHVAHRASDEIASLRTEIARLRTALQRIADGHADTVPSRYARRALANEQILHDRCEQLIADNARLRSALGGIDYRVEDGNPFNEGWNAALNAIQQAHDASEQSVAYTDSGEPYDPRGTSEQEEPK